MKNFDPQGVRAVCETVLPDGRFASCSAESSCLGKKSLEAIKVKATYRQTLYEALLSARMAELRFDDSFRVTVENTDQLSQEYGRLLELPALLADRRVRGLLGSPAQRTIAIGLSSNWIDGIIKPARLDWHRQCLQVLADTTDLGSAEILLPTPPNDDCARLHERIQSAHPSAKLRELDSLASLHGHPTAGAKLRRASVWFPVVCGDAEQDSLLEVEVVLRAGGNAAGMEDKIDIMGLPAMKPEVKEKAAMLLQGLRRQDPHAPGEWRTLVRFPREGFDGGSFEFALAMADRIARGRDFAGIGPIIATGAMQIGADDEPTGYVQHVEEIERKCITMLAGLQAGSRILMPLSWRGQVPSDFVQKLADKGGTCAFVNQVS